MVVATSQPRRGIVSRIGRIIRVAFSIPFSLMRIAEALEKIDQHQQQQLQQQQEMLRLLQEFQTPSRVALDRLSDTATALGAISFRMNDLVSVLEIIADYHALQAKSQVSFQEKNLGDTDAAQ